MAEHPRSHRLAPIAAVLGAAALFGTTGTAQALGPAGATPLGIGAARLLLGALALAALAGLQAPAGGRCWRRHRAALLAGGACVAVYQLAWFAGLRRTGVALGTTVGIGSGPVLAGLLHLLRRRRGLSTTWLVGTILTVVGATLLATRGAGPSAADPSGLGLVLLAVLAYVLYTELAQQAIQGGLDASGAMAGMFTAGAVLLLPLLVLEPMGWLASARGAAMALHLGLLTVGVAYSLYGWGLRHLSVPTVVTLTLGEPLTAAVLGVALLGERLGPPGWLGAGLVGAGLVAASRGDARAAARDGDRADVVGGAPVPPP